MSDFEFERRVCSRSRPQLRGRPVAACRGVGRIGLLLTLLAALLVGAAGYAWYWLQRPLPAQMEAAENALFDGELVAVGWLDVERLLTLQQLWFGAPDPAALGVDDAQQALLDKLFHGKPHLAERLRQAMFSINPGENGDGSRNTLLLWGDFEAESLPEALVETLADDYRMEQLEPGVWHAEQKQAAAIEPLCDNQPATQAAARQFYIRITDQWLVVADDRAHGDHIWQRLQSGASAAQDSNGWRAYRGQRLFAVMAMTPTRAGKALGGLAGMIAHGAARETPEVTAGGVSLAVAPLQMGLNANLRLISADSAWTRATAASTRSKLAEMAQDSRSVSPTLAGILSRVSVTESATALDLDMRLDSALADDLGQALQEGLASVFSVTGMSPTGGGSTAEVIIDNPPSYPALTLSSLPVPELPSYQAAPLFSDGPFSLDLQSLKPTDQGQLELWLSAKAGLPDNSDGRFNGSGRFTLSIDSITDADGREQLADERCLSRNDLGGRSPNHEPESNSNHHHDHAWVWKHVRLKPGAGIDSIKQISGRMTFSVPSRVSRFELPLKAGEVVEHAGLRFYLASIKADSVSYQLSGDVDRLLEVRALNAAGQALQPGWKMSAGEGGRTTQSYQGQVAGLAIYIADSYFEQQTRFSVTDIFPPAATSADPAPAWFAPQRMDPQRWQAYSGLDLNALEIDPRGDWGMWDKDIKPVAQQQWPGLRLFVTHKPEEWGNHPKAHLYLPQLAELPAVLSALSYRIDNPAPPEAAVERFVRVSYPYFSDSGEVVSKRRLQGLPIAISNFPMNSGLEANQLLDRLSGEIIVRLPLQTRSTRLALDALWEPQTVDGIKVSLSDVSRGSFPGYSFKVDGDITRFVNLHGLTADGQRIAAKPINFQDDGYWTLTLPFTAGMTQIELVSATEQKVLRYPFDLTAQYSAKPAP